MRATCSLGFAVLLATATAGTTEAQPIQFAFADGSGAFRDSFNIPAQGGAVDIQVFISDTGDPSPFLPNPNQTNNLNTNGLVGAAFRLSSDAPGVARVNTTGDVSLNPAFNFSPTVAVNGGNVDVSELALVFGGGIPTGGTGRIYLATLRFTAFASSGSTILGFSDFSTAFGQTSLGNAASPATNGGAVLDPANLPATPGLFSNSATITIGAVPEPSSLMLVGLGLAAVAVRPWARRRGDSITVSGESGPGAPMNQL